MCVRARALKRCIILRGKIVRRYFSPRHSENFCLVNYKFTIGLSCLRTDGRRPDHEELSVSGIDVVRSDDPKVQLVVLRGLQSLEEPVRQQHTHQQKLSADEGVGVLLGIQESRQRHEQCAREPR